MGFPTRFLVGEPPAGSCSFRCLVDRLTGPIKLLDMCVEENKASYSGSVHLRWFPFGQKVTPLSKILQDPALKFAVMTLFKFCSARAKC